MDMSWRAPKGMFRSTASSAVNPAKLCKMMDPKTEETEAPALTAITMTDEKLARCKISEYFINTYSYTASTLVLTRPPRRASS